MIKFYFYFLDKSFRLKNFYWVAKGLLKKEREFSKQGTVLNKIGNLFFTGLTGTSLTSDEECFIRDFNLGGVILFQKNYDNRDQLKSLCAQIKRIRPDILIATDHEGGRVQRFRNELWLRVSLDDGDRKTWLSKALLSGSRANGKRSLNFLWCKT